MDSVVATVVSASVTLALLHYFDNDPRMLECRRRLRAAFDRVFPQLTKYLPDDRDTAKTIRHKYDILINQEPKPLRAASIIIGAAVLIPLLCVGAADAAAA